MTVAIDQRIGAPGDGLGEIGAVLARTMKPPAPLAVDEWADQERRLTRRVTDRPGRWRTDDFPYLREPMRAWTEPGVRMVVMQFASQTGKTEALMNMLLRSIDLDPGPTLYVLPNEVMARTINQDRLQPTIMETPAAARRLGPAKRDVKAMQINFDAMNLWLSGANSPGNLAMRPCRYVFGDDLHDWPESTGGHQGSAVELALQRLDAYVDGRACFVSTPTEPGVGVNRLFNMGDQCVYAVPCPHCAGYQTLEFGAESRRGGVRWPTDSCGENLDAAEHAALMRQARDQAWYECRWCAGRIEDAHKPAMLRAGRWIGAGQQIEEGGRIEGERQPSSIRSFRLSKLYSPLKTFGEIAAGLIANRGDRTRAWVNGDLGEVWRPPAQARETSALLELAAQQPSDLVDYNRRTVPAGVVAVTGALDVQADGCWFEVAGWARGQRKYLIDWGWVSCPGADPEHRIWPWRAVMELMGRDYLSVETDEQGHARESWRATAWAIDSGHRTKEVYDFCRQSPAAIWAMKGQDRLVTPIRERILEKLSDGRPAPDTVRLLVFDTDYWRNEVATRSQRLAPAPGAFCWPRDLGEDYARQFTAEQRVQVREKRGLRWIWRLKPGRYDNHWWDCAVMHQALAEHLGLRELGAEAPESGSDQRGPQRYRRLRGRPIR